MWMYVFTYENWYFVLTEQLHAHGYWVLFVWHWQFEQQQTAVYCFASTTKRQFCAFGSSVVQYFFVIVQKRYFSF